MRELIFATVTAGVLTVIWTWGVYGRSIRERLLAHRDLRRDRTAREREAARLRREARRAADETKGEGGS